MLSYQHLYHAGNLADVQKHSVLAWTLNYLIQKDKPLTYMETHAGRGLYDLTAAEAVKTGEAAKGIALAQARNIPALFLLRDDDGISERVTGPFDELCRGG